MNKAGFLPSTGVMLSLDLKQYYEPLRLPSRSAALSFPYTRRSVASPPSQWISSTGQLNFQYMPTLLPRRFVDVASILRTSTRRPSLYRDEVGNRNSLRGYICCRWRRSARRRRGLLAAEFGVGKRLTNRRNRGRQAPGEEPVVCDQNGGSEMTTLWCVTRSSRIYCCKTIS